MHINRFILCDDRMDVWGSENNEMRAILYMYSMVICSIVRDTDIFAEKIHRQVHTLGKQVD